MIAPSALNVLTIGFSMVIFIFLWRMGAAHLLKNNSESPLGKAMGVVFG